MMASALPVTRSPGTANVQAVQYLDSLLGRTLHIHTSDLRLFVGAFKCTDNERNIILANTYEYRHPTTKAVGDAALDQPGDAKNVVVDMTSRFIGLVVVPGKHITKIEVDEGTYGYR